ncbi:PF20097 family protein [Sphingomonas sp. AOB5]|uniref:PF20097 family protein n=1 Tax=Sphingomonas sp. AOB5 TaxID=3034017 RepID=UPI0023F96F71|nr:PF20097 family protein [Sphingomonas sp. AOB5]MDF7775136.1 PF20097 family protein [Sphingomonas sp. AOB5]
MRSNACPKCQGSMTQGFVLAETQGMKTVSSWVEGSPVKGWFGVKLGKRVTHEIQSWRCTRCGYLENYAKG